jgi:hypothetical protein
MLINTWLVKITLKNVYSSPFAKHIDKRAKRKRITILNTSRMHISILIAPPRPTWTHIWPDMGPCMPPYKDPCWTHVWAHIEPMFGYRFCNGTQINLDRNCAGLISGKISALVCGSRHLLIIWIRTKRKQPHLQQWQWHRIRSSGAGGSKSNILKEQQCCKRRLHPNAYHPSTLL